MRLDMERFSFYVIRTFTLQLKDDNILTDTFHCLLGMNEIKYKSEKEWLTAGAPPFYSECVSENGRNKVGEADQSSN